MIKFFRRIRQNLLLEGKTGKYFKYAIGEIVLVVIGILIALSINNMNSSQIEKSEITAYLKRLKTEYTTNVTRANYLLDETDNHPLVEQIEIVDSALNSFHNGIDSGNIETILRPDLFWYNQFRMTRDVQKEGMNTSILFKIKNKDLIAEIQKQQALMDGRQEWVDKEIVDYRSVFNEATKFRYMRPQNKYREVRYTNNDLANKLINNSWLLDDKSESYQLAYLSISTFRYVLDARVGYLHSEIDGDSKLISLIDQELSK
jgi:hypothetical protein